MTRFKLGRKGAAAVVAAVCVGAIAIAAVAAAASVGTTPTVTVLKIRATGGGPPAAERPGQISVITGSVLDDSVHTIGTWRWRCTYLGGNGEGASTSHFCRFKVTLTGRGSITTEGGYGYNSSAVRWEAVLGGTGAYKGVFGVARLYNLNTASTPHTYYLLTK
jgi:hypothetical protein